MYVVDWYEYDCYCFECSRLMDIVVFYLSVDYKLFFGIVISLL